MNNLKVKSAAPYDDEKIAKTNEYIDSHPAMHFTTSELAEISVLSDKNFIRLFKTITGSTPNQYIIRRE